MTGALRRAKIRWRAELKDAISYGAAGRLGRILFSLMQLALTSSPPKQVAREIALIRLLGAGALRSWLVRRVQRAIDHQPDVVIQAHTSFGGKGLDGQPVTRTAMLKAPGANGERGVIYSLFEYNWARIAAGTNLRVLLSEYDVVWVASWSPTDYLPLARILADSDPGTPIYVQASNMAEVPLLETFHPRIRALPFLSCESVNPASFQPLPRAERDIDLLVVSNWAPFKRHFELFRALRLLPAGLRIVCVGQQEQGHTREGIRQLAASYRVPQQITYYESLPWTEVRALQVRSKAAAIFSRREGHCIAAVEALFADASLGLMHGGHVGPAIYISDTNGVLLRPGHVSEDLARLIEDAPSRTPREWALAHIGSGRAEVKLNDWLKERAAERSLPWTTDIAQMSYAPYPRVESADACERLRPAFDALHRAFPKVFEADLFESNQKQRAT